MKYRLDKNQRPVYLQLYRLLRDDIIAENYPYHTKLPSKRCLAEETGVSTITVEHAYELLCDEGYVEARQRSGYVVIFRNFDGFAASTTLPTQHFSVQSSHCYDSFPLTVLSKTMRKALTDHGELLLEKSPNCGCDALRSAIRHYLARNRGIVVDAEQIELAKAHGLRVRLWGVTDEEIMKKVYPLDTDGMTVNFPDKLVRYLADK